MEDELGQQLEENIAKVKARIKHAARRSGRDEGSISLVAITKQKPATTVKALADYGIRRIGESYFQEAVFKIDLLKDYDIEWHMVGNIQRGKEKHIALNFDVVHSVGALRTARELNKSGSKIEKTLPIFLELNVSGENTKQGWEATDQRGLEALVPEFEEILDYPFLKVMGLMTMAPYSSNPEDSRRYFKRIREIRGWLRSVFPSAGLADLSMGMSGDFEVAIEEGSTVVRIGTALVGPR